jgi:hypothetical protein
MQWKYGIFVFIEIHALLEIVWSSDEFSFDIKQTRIIYTFINRLSVVAYSDMLW